MNVPPFQDPLPGRLLTSPTQTSAQQPAMQGSATASVDVVDLSESAQSLMKQFLANNNPAASQTGAEGRVPSAAQSADTILGFIAATLQQRIAEGASEQEMQALFEQAVTGVKKGFVDAFNIIKGMGLMSDELRASAIETKYAVLDGISALRDSYLGSQVEEGAEVAAAPVSSQVTAFRQASSQSLVTQSRPLPSGEQGNIQRATSVYASQYQRGESIELALKTLDGDIVTLSYSSNFSASRSITAFLSNSDQSVAAVGSYQRNSQLSSSINFTVQGNLSQQEQDALNTLLKQVSELADELFNGDFSEAWSLANEFELDTDVFSALSLDVARSTSVNVLEAYTASGRSQAGEQLDALTSSNPLETVLAQLTAALDVASQFADPDQLLTDLLANQVALRSMPFADTQNQLIARTLDQLLQSA